MTIKEVEEYTGLARSNIRFYEKEKLIKPQRNADNGYRDYSQEDVENIKKIAYLRTLGISIEEIGRIMSDKVSLLEVIEKQKEELQGQITSLNKARSMCEKMLASENLSYDDLQIEQFVTELPDYWDENKPVFKLDLVSFLYLWGSHITWIVITALCLVIGILSYGKLPPEIPVQWSEGEASSLVSRIFIFAYPAVCVIIRAFLRPYIRVQAGNHLYNDIVTEYVTNYASFIALSVEVFSILFIYGLVKNIVAVLLVDTIVLIGLLVAGIVKLEIRA